MYLQQSRGHQFLINVFLYHDDFENSGEKNKRGSVDLYMFTGRGFDFFAQRQRSHALATNPISGIDCVGDFASQPTNICDSQQRRPINKVLFREESSKVLFLLLPNHSHQC